MLLPYACADDTSAASDGDDQATMSTFPFVPPDSPLLPNLGKANVHGYLIDIMVRLAVHLVRGIEAALTERASR